MRILIVDAHWTTRLGLATFLTSLDPDTDVVEASTLDEAARLIAGRRRFDLCLLDCQWEGENPISVLRQLRQATPKVPILVVTAAASRRLALDAVEEGASGCVLKSSSPDELARAIQRVCEGDIWLPAGLRDMPADRGIGQEEKHEETPLSGTNPSFAALTPRQRQVLELIATGKRNADIAEALSISPRTVQIHVSTILKLLKVSNRTEAALLVHGRDPNA